MCLVLVVGANSVIAFTFCFMGKIPFHDTKCPKYSLLKSFHSGILNLIPASQIFKD